jgi:hypothetical protein
MPLRVIENKERLYEALLECAPLRSLCFLVIEKLNISVPALPSLWFSWIN